MNIFRDPTLALTAALVVGLTGVTGAALAVGDAHVEAVAVADGSAAVRDWRSHLGQLLRLGATRDAGLHQVASRLAARAETQADVHAGTALGDLWHDAAGHARTLATVDLADAAAVDAAVAGVTASADALAATVFDGQTRSVTVGGDLDTDLPPFERDPRRPGTTVSPRVPARPHVPGAPMPRPTVAPDAPSAPVHPPAVPSVPSPAPSVNDQELPR